MRPKSSIKFFIGLTILFCLFIPSVSFAETAGQGKGIQLLENITDQTTVIKGITYPNATVKVVSKSALLNSTKANAAGEFSLEIARQSAGMKLTISADDGTNTYTLDVTTLKTGWVQQDGRSLVLLQQQGRKRDWLDRRSW